MFLAHILHEHPDIPVVVMTGYGFPEFIRKASKDRATGCIRKPFVMKALGRKIIVVLQRESKGGTNCSTHLG